MKGGDRVPGPSKRETRQAARDLASDGASKSQKSESGGDNKKFCAKLQRAARSRLSRASQ